MTLKPRRIVAFTASVCCLLVSGCDSQTTPPINPSASAKDEEIKKLRDDNESLRACVRYNTISNQCTILTRNIQDGTESSMAYLQCMSRHDNSATPKGCT